jgi:hypothetical protein
MTVRYTTTLIVAGLLIGCSNPQADYDAARSQDTVEAYQSFIDQYPDNPLAEQARQRIREIQESRAWQQAQDSGTIEAYQRFLQQYPQSPHEKEANDALRSLQADASWMQLRGSQDIGALQNFINRFPDSSHVQQAQNRLEQLTKPKEPPPPPPPPPEGDYQVQFAAFRDENLAQQAAARLKETYASLLGDTEVRVEPPPQGSSYYRVRTAGIDRDAADQLCSRLKQAGQDCLVVPR